LPKLLFQELTILIAGRVERMKLERYAFILIADEKYWNLLRERNRASSGTYAFVRRSKVAPKSAQKLLFYVKKPVMQIKGIGDFVERVTGDSGELWRKHGNESCFETFEDYQNFTQGRMTMTFVRFRNFVEIENPKTKEATRSILGSLQGFRGRYVDLATTKQLVT
jgi:predicted transcriptional regulator